MSGYGQNSCKYSLIWVLIALFKSCQDQKTPLNYGPKPIPITIRAILSEPQVGSPKLLPFVSVICYDIPLIFF